MGAGLPTTTEIIVAAWLAVAIGAAAGVLGMAMLIAVVMAADGDPLKDPLDGDGETKNGGRH